MSKSRYPIKLRENIIVDAVFEMRFDAQKGFSDLVPGKLKELFSGFQDIERLPLADIPSHLREGDSNLKYQPIMRMTWENVILIVGDHSLGLGYRGEYVSWKTFKTCIDQLLEWLVDDNDLGKMINSVTRYSLKYVDFIPDKFYTDIEDPFNVKLLLGGDNKGNHNLKFQLENKESFGVSFFEFMNPVQASSDNQKFERGVLITTDTVRNLSLTPDLNSLQNDFNLQNEIMHSKNKELFFSILSQQLLKNLGAQYE